MRGRLAFLGSILLALAIATGCDRGRLAGVGATCGPQNACASFLVCVAGRCQPPGPQDASEAGSETGSPPRDAPTDEPVRASDGPGGRDGPDGRDGGNDAVVPVDATDAPGDPPSAPPDAPLGRPEPNELPRVFSFAVTGDGQLWMGSGTVNTALPGQDVAGNAANMADLVPGPAIGAIDDVETQAIGPEVNVLARAGGVVSVTSLRGKAWTPWSRVTAGIRTMGLANLGGVLAACLVDTAGRLRIGTRIAADAWTELRDVTDLAVPAVSEGPAPRPLIKIDCAGLGDTLELVAIDESHELWSADVRATDWQHWRRVENPAGWSLRDVDASNGVGVLHVLASSADTQFHVARAPNGPWTAPDDIQALTGTDPPGSIFAGAAASIFTDLVFYQVTSAGKIWGAFRSVNLVGRYYLGGSWPDRMWVNIASTAVLP